MPLQVFHPTQTPKESFLGSIGKGFHEGFTSARDFDRQLQLQDAKGKKDKSLADQEKFVTGLDIIGKMREVVDRGRTGRGSGFFGMFGGDTARDRQELEQLGKSLIPLVAAGVPIRNQKEFEEYRKTITDPGALTDEMLGALEGLEKIMHSKLQGKESGEAKPGKSAKKERAPLESFYG